MTRRASARVFRRRSRRIGVPASAWRCLGLAGICVVMSFLIAACAAPVLRSPGRFDRSKEPIEFGDRVMLTGVVVDTSYASGTFTIKDEQDYVTWTIMISPETRVYGATGGITLVNEVEIGRTVRVSGTTRVPSILEAAEIDLQETSVPAGSPVQRLFR